MGRETVGGLEGCSWDSEPAGLVITGGFTEAGDWPVLE